MTFTATAGDDGSGLARVEYGLDGGAWQAYTAPVTIGDGEHTLRLRAFDLAGNVAEAAPLTFRVDGTPPRPEMAEVWYIWDEVDLVVEESGSGLRTVRLRIEDGRGRWPAFERTWRLDGRSGWGESFVWDRRFGDGTLAPIGAYRVTLWAEDEAGNAASVEGEVRIPAPGEATATPAPTRTAAPTASPTAAVVVLPAAPAPTQAAVVAVEGFGKSEAPAGPVKGPSGAGVLYGAAAAALIGAATAQALEAQRRRKEEEARARAEAQARNAAAEARERAWAEQVAAARQAAQAQEAQQVETPPLPQGISPEAQQAFLHGGPEAQKWIHANQEKLRQQYQAQRATATPTLTPVAQINPASALGQKLKQMGDGRGWGYLQVCAVILKAEAGQAPAEDRRWFSGSEDDPAKIYTEAAARWFWTWGKSETTKNFLKINQNMDIMTDPDRRQATLYDWLAHGMESAQGRIGNSSFWSGDAVDERFLRICQDVFEPKNPAWRAGDGMWSWANAYLYDPYPKAQNYLQSHYRYKFGQGRTAWYIVDADTVRMLDFLKTEK